MGKILECYAMPHPPIMIPEIGKGEEKKVAKTLESCRIISDKIKALAPDTIIVITPHGTVFRDAIAILRAPKVSGNLAKFGVPTLKFDIEINEELTNSIIKLADSENILIAPISNNSKKEYNVLLELDHGSMVPLYFVNEKYKDYKIVHITYGMLSKIDLYKFGMLVKSAVEQSSNNAVIIASGDLSHRLSEDGPYDYSPIGIEFDKKIITLLEEGDVLGIFNMDRTLIESAGECGLRSFYILLGILEGTLIKGNLLSYEGPFGVGYGVLTFPMDTPSKEHYLERFIHAKKSKIESLRKNESDYVKLARESLEYYIKTGEFISMPHNVPNEMLKSQNGVFVSLKKDGELRGCIGTIFPVTDCTAEEIIRNAVEAGEHDPRFFPVEEEELEEITYSVDVLMAPEKSTKEELDPKNYGVIVRKGSKAGLLLPDLEGVDTIDKQLEIALDKAGISHNDNYSIEKFEVIRYK